MKLKICNCTPKGCPPTSGALSEAFNCLVVLQSSFFIQPFLKLGKIALKFTCTPALTASTIVFGCNKNKSSLLPSPVGTESQSAQAITGEKQIKAKSKILSIDVCKYCALKQNYECFKWVLTNLNGN